jgi:hypothetical protein
VIFEAVAVFENQQAQDKADQDVSLVQANAEAIFDDGLFLGRRQSGGRRDHGGIHGLPLRLLPQGPSTR